MTQLALFGSMHEAGGKVKSALPAGLRGDAVFYGDRQEYRPLLRRWIGDVFPNRYALFLGMNPSTASEEVNDPTITREWGFTVREGFSAFVKCNVADYRATFPKDLLAPGIVPSSPENLLTILRWAAGAELVIVCHGCLNKALAPTGREVVAALRDVGIQMKCFGKTADGSARHPLYLAADTPLVDYL